MAEESHSVFQNFASEPERYLKLFPLGLGTIYIVGFLVVALELAGYGTSPLELVKIQYLAAGFWCGLVVLTYYGLTTLFRSLYSELISFELPFVNRGRLLAAIMASLATVLVVIGGSAASLYILPKIWWISPPIIGRMFARFSWLQSVGPIVIPLAFFDITLRVYRSRNEGAEPPRKFRIRKWLFIIFCVCGLTVGSVAYIVSFARYVYPNIPFSLGGGQTRQVIFWLGDSAGTADSFLERDGAKPYTISYELLVEGENSLVVVSPKEGQQVIEVDRKSVGAMVVLGNRTGPAHVQRGTTEGEPSH